MIPAIDPQKQKLVKCLSGCGRQLAVGKYASNAQTCGVCAATSPSKAPTGPQSADTAIAAAVAGGSATPRLDIQEIQRVLNSHGFVPAAGGEWSKTVPLNSGVARATVRIDNGTTMAPNPAVHNVTIQTQVSIPLSSIGTPVNWKPAELLDSVQALADTLRVASDPVVHRHIVSRECDICTNDSPEFWVLDGKVVCLHCAGGKR